MSHFKDKQLGELVNYMILIDILLLCTDLLADIEARYQNFHLPGRLALPN